MYNIIRAMKFYSETKKVQRNKIRPLINKRKTTILRSCLY